MSVIGTGGAEGADAQPASTTVASTIRTAGLIARDTFIALTQASPVATILFPWRLARYWMPPVDLSWAIRWSIFETALIGGVWHSRYLLFTI
jgi:hypothetical protein